MDKIEDKISNNTISGFRKCGIHPLNLEMVIERFPEGPDGANNGSQETVDNQLDNCFVSFLKALQPRQGNVRKTKKQLHIQA